MSIHRSSFTGTYDGVTVRLWANGLEVGNGVVAPGVVTYGLAISDNFSSENLNPATVGRFKVSTTFVCGTKL